MTGSTRGRRADIQGMRALAVTLVVLDHLTGHPRGGFTGVDIFFVISGFLITGLLAREADESGRFSIRGFYGRRARRILPVALITLVTVDLLARGIFVGRRVAQTTHDSLWALGFAANIHFAHVGTDYFDAHRPPSPLQHFWSLAVEEQFYLLWPTVLLILFAALHGRAVNRRAGATCVAALITVASFIWCLRATEANSTSAYFSTLARAWELGVGALLALGYSAACRIPTALRRALGWAGLATVLIGAFRITASTEFPGRAALWPVLGAAAMIAGGEVPGGIGARWALGMRPIVFLGTISYSVYLWHWPAITFADSYYGTGTARAHVVAAIATLTLSITSFYLIEQPILQWRNITFWRPSGGASTSAGRALRDRWLTAATVTAVTWPTLLATGALAAPGHAPPIHVAVPPNPTTSSASLLAARQRLIASSLDASSWKHLDPSLDDLERAGAPEWQRDDCLDVNNVPGAVRCTYGPPNAAHSLVVLGDSFAISAVPGIRAALPDWSVHVLTKRECPNLLGVRTFERTLGVDNTACTKHKIFALDQIARLHPDLVVISASSDLYERLIDVDPAGPQETWQRGTTAMLSALKQRARRMVIIGSTTNSGNLESCVTTSSSPADCVRPIPARWRAVRAAEQAAATSQGIRYVDPSPWLCLDNECPAVIGTTPVYWDGAHLTATEARQLAPFFLQALG